MTSFVYSLVTFFLFSLVWEFEIKSIMPQIESYLINLIVYFASFVLSLAVFVLTFRPERDGSPENLDFTSSDGLARSIFEHAHDAIITINADSRITRWNKTAESIFGWSEAEVLNSKLSDFIIPAKFRDAHSKGIAHFISTGEGPVLNTCIELFAVKKDGDEIPVEITISAIPWQNSYIFSGIVRDISERKKMEQELQQNQIRLEDNNRLLQELAIQDGLTQISNRRFLDEYLPNEWKRAARDKYSVSLVMIDLDFFKPYNDTYGHQSGDECLKRVAEKIKGVLHRPADIAARYGGEEFIVVLPETEVAGALKISEEIRSEIESLRIEHSGSKVSSYVTASLGVATLLPSEILSDPKVLIQKADEALYEAKNQGRNRVIVCKMAETN